MARWRLTAPHYLQVPGTEWEYKEVDRITGKPVRRTFAVPTLIDPNQPGDWTHRNGDQGEVIVCQGNGDARDIKFVGEPTPDMMPLDDEAKAISAKFAAKWKHPIESLPNSYSEVVLDDLQKEVAKARAAQSSPQKIEGVEEILAAMAAMMKQNQELIKTLVPRRVA